MNPASAPIDIFDRRRRRALRERAGQRAAPNMFLWRHIAEDIADRLSYVTRSFQSVLIIGPLAAFADQIFPVKAAELTLASLSEAEAAATGGHCIEEDRLPYASASFDLIICGGTLDSVNDLPGALIQIRRSLMSDGLFLGTLFGLGSLQTIKALMMQTDAERGVAHIHPQIDLRAAADLLTRAGFTLPVADQDDLMIRYSALQTLRDDLHDLGTGNALAGPRPYFGKVAYERLLQLWDDRCDDAGKVEERFNLIQLSGWAPSPDQPKPAKRGSGTVSLAEALRRGGGA